MACAVCEAIGEQVVWGNGVPASVSYSVIAKLETVSETDRKCPSCGAHFAYSIEYEHASDHFMPDTTETLTRVKSPCDVCRELGNEVSWGNASFAKLYGPPAAVEKLATIANDVRECPGCGAWFEYAMETEHAADSFRPDICEKLTRVR